MSANFEVIGKLKAMKATDTFSPYEEKVFDSGWKKIRYQFNVITDDGNRTRVAIEGGRWTDDSKNVIYTKSRANGDKKSENITVKWSDRHNKDVIKNVAGNRIYTCSLATFNEEREMDAAEKATVRHQFIERTEFAEFMRKLIEGGEYKDTKFKVMGTVDFQYNPNSNIFYRTLTVDKIYKVEDDIPCKAEMTLNAFFAADCVDQGEDKHIVNCYTDYYFNDVKERLFVPVPLVLRQRNESDVKRIKNFIERFTTFDTDAEVRTMSLTCSMIDGAERKRITFDDLSDETKELIACDMLTEEDAIKELGGFMRGNSIQETRIEKCGVKGAEDTNYSVENLMKKPIKKEEVFDLFADDDEI